MNPRLHVEGFEILTPGEQAVLGDMLFDGGHAVYMCGKELMWENHVSTRSWVCSASGIRGPNYELLTRDTPWKSSTVVLDVFRLIMERVTLPEANRQMRLVRELVGPRWGGWEFVPSWARGWPTVKYKLSAPFTGDIPVIYSEGPYFPMTVSRPVPYAVGYGSTEIGKAKNVDEVVEVLVRTFGEPEEIRRAG